MIKRLIVTTAVFMALLIPSIAYASDITNATYIGTVRVSNNSTATTYVAVPISGANSTNLLNGNYFAAAFSDAALRYSGSDLAFMPGFGLNPWVVWVPSIGANNYQNDLLYNGSTGGTIRYFPGAAGGSVANSASTNITDNGSVSVTGWFAPTVSGNISGKLNSYNLIGDGSGAVTLTGDYHSPGAASGWTNSSNAIDGNTATYAENSTPATSWTAYLTATITPRTIDSIHYWYDDVPGGVFSLVEITIWNGSTWSTSYNGTPGAELAWVTRNITAAANISQIRIRFYNSVGTTQSVRVHELTYDGNLVSHSGVTAAEHTFNVYKNNTFLGFGIDNTSVIPPVTDNLDLVIPLWSSLLTASDFSSVDNYGHSINVTGATWSNQGRVFDGNDYLKHTEANWRASDPAGTIIAWFNTSSAGTMALVASADEATTSYSFSFRVDTGTIRVFQTNNDLADHIRGSSTVNDGSWHMGSLVSSGAAYSMYVDDGAAEVLTIISGANTGDWLSDTTLRDNLTFGVMIRTAPVIYFTGTIGEGLYFSEALTPAEIASIYNATRGKYVGASAPDTFDYISDNGSFVDNANPIIFAANNVMPYAQTANITRAGTVTANWGDPMWEYAATFTDDTGNGNTMTPSFRTTSSNANVSAALLSFDPISQSNAPAYSINTTTYNFIGENITTSSNFTTTPSTGFAFFGVLSDVSTAGNTPYQLPLLLGALFTILAISFGVTYMLKGNQTSSLLAQVFIVGTLMGFAVSLNVFDEWMLIYFVPIAIGCAMASGTLFQGTGNTGNNIFGFAVMNFIGWTTINRILAGQLVQTSDMTIVQNFLAFQPFSVFGWFTIPVPNVNFLTNGIPALFNWDEYTFLAGNAQFVTYLMYSITAIVSMFLFVLAIGAIYQLFSRSR